MPRPNEGNRARTFHVASPISGSDLFVTAEFERWVSVYSLADRRRISRFETIMDFGGQRLALIGRDRTIVVTAAYTRYGVAAYDALTGERIWHRKDLKRAHWLAPLAEGSAVAVGFDNKPLHVLDGQTGETVDRWRGVRKVVSSAFSSEVICTTNSCVNLGIFPGENRWVEVLADRAVLTAAFGPTAVALQHVWFTNSPGAVPGDDERHTRLLSFDLEGNPLWEWKPAPYCQLNEIGWCDETQHWVGLEWSWQQSGPLRIVRIDPSGGLIERGPEVVARDVAFLGRGKYLVTNMGSVIHVPDGQTLWTFEPEQQVS